MSRPALPNLAAVRRAGHKDLAPRIAEGFSLLNRFIPGWRDHIDVEFLDIGDPRCCVLGQLGEGDFPYSDAAGMLNISDVEEQVLAGFERDQENYSALTEAWLLALSPIEEGG